MKKTTWLVFAAAVLVGCSTNAQVPIGKDTVVTMDYTGTLKNGTVFDSSSQHGQPFTFIQGEGQIIPGLAKGLAGLKTGDTKTIVVPAAEAYPYNKNMVVTVPKSQFPKGMDIKDGVEVASRTPNGTLQGKITKVGKDTVTVDFNLPIAGKELIFKVHILGVRKATSDEISGKVKPTPVLPKKKK